MKRMKHLFVISFVVLCLALTTSRDTQARQGGGLKGEAAQYLAVHEPLLQQTDDQSLKLYLLLNLAPAALAAGDEGKAAAYAQELISLGEGLKSSPGFGPGMYSNAAHVGNLVLGRIALSGGDVGKAKEHLLAAGRVPGSSVLKSFGPDMTLAKALIEKGECEAVIEYFDLCAKFWEMQNGKLEQWKSVVRQGGTPNFGPSLGRVFDTWRFAK